MRAENSGSCFVPLLISSSVACQHMVKGKGSDFEGQAVAAQGKLMLHRASFATVSGGKGQAHCASRCKDFDCCENNTRVSHVAG